MKLDEITDSVLEDYDISLQPADQSPYKELEVVVIYKNSNMPIVIGYIYQIPDRNGNMFRIRGNRDFENRSLKNTVKALIFTYLQFKEQVDACK